MQINNYSSNNLDTSVLKVFENLASGKQDPFGASQMMTDSYNPNNFNPVQDAWGNQYFGVPAGGYISDVGSVAIDGDFKKATMGTMASAIQRATFILSQGAEGLSTFLQSSFGMDEETSSQMAKKLYLRINQLNPLYASQMTQTLNKLKNSINNLDQTIEVNKAQTSATNKKISEAIQGFNGA